MRSREGAGKRRECLPHAEPTASLLLVLPVPALSPHHSEFQLCICSAVYIETLHGMSVIGSEETMGWKWFKQPSSPVQLAPCLSSSEKTIKRSCMYLHAPQGVVCQMHLKKDEPSPKNVDSTRNMLAFKMSLIFFFQWADWNGNGTNESNFPSLVLCFYFKWIQEALINQIIKGGDRDATWTNGMSFDPMEWFKWKGALQRTVLGSRPDTSCLHFSWQYPLGRVSSNLSIGLWCWNRSLYSALLSLCCPIRYLLHFKCSITIGKNVKSGWRCWKGLESETSPLPWTEARNSTSSQSFLKWLSSQKLLPSKCVSHCRGLFSCHNMQAVSPYCNNLPVCSVTNYAFLLRWLR